MKKLITCTLLFFTFSVFAKGFSPAVTAAPGGYNIRVASNGTPLAVPATNNVSGAAHVVAPASIALPGGISYPALATAVITGASMAGPWGQAIAIAVAAGGIGVAVLDQAISAAKIRVAADRSKLEAQVDGCPTGCSEWFDQFDTWHSSFAAAADASIGKRNLQFQQGNVVFSLTRLQPSNSYVFFSITDKSDGSVRSSSTELVKRDLPPSPSTWVPISTPAAVEKLTMRAPTAAEVQAMVDLNFPPAVEIPTITGPASVPKANTIEMGLDGSIREIDERYIASFSPGFVGFNTASTTTVKTPSRLNTSVTTNSDGSTSTSVITIPGTTSILTTTTATPQPSTPESISVTVETCGLPGKPECAISELGMPGQLEVDSKLKTSPKDVQKDIDDIAKNPGSFFPPFPTLNWSFALPTGCASIQVPAFAPYITEIDVCQFQPVFHDIMGVVWMLGGLFGAISLFMKNALSS